MKRLSLILGGLLLSLNATAATVLYDTSLALGYNITYTNYTTFYNNLTGQHTLDQQSGAVNSLAGITPYDAIWVDGYYGAGGAMSTQQEDNIRDYIALGHKAVFITDNSSWAARNDSIEDITGATIIDVCSGSTGTPVSAHSLTTGVSQFGSGSCNSLLDSGVGEMLFSNNMAGLYSVGLGEALVITSVDFHMNGNINSYNNLAFFNNVITWLGEPVDVAPVPAPASVILLGMGLVGLVLRRKRG